MQLLISACAAILLTFALAMAAFPASTGPLVPEDQAVPGSAPGPFFEAGGEVLFPAEDGLWRTDGTPRGTSRISRAHAAHPSVVGDTLYFVSWSRTQSGAPFPQIWKSDGTSAGTVPVIQVGSTSTLEKGISTMIASGDSLYFVHTIDSRHAVRTYDTSTGTLDFVEDYMPWYPSYLTVSGAIVYFSGFVPGMGEEPRRARAWPLKDINPGAESSWPRNFMDAGGRLFFTAYQPETGSELWTSDGTEEGTVLVDDVEPGQGSSNPRGLIHADGVVFFAAFREGAGLELWKSDGTPSGTFMVADIEPGERGSDPAGFFLLDGTLYFSADRGGLGKELWKSDGTEGGTVLVRDIMPGEEGSSPSQLTAVDGLLYFTAFHRDRGIELWKSDGSAEGTLLVADLNPGEAGSGPTFLSSAGGRLFFVATLRGLGIQPCVSDGTRAGTRPLLVLEPGSE